MKSFAAVLVVFVLIFSVSCQSSGTGPGSGNEVITFEKTFGGNGDDFGASVQQTSDGGYIVVGYTSSFGHGGEDVYLIKTDAQGNLLWQKTFGGSDNDDGSSVQQTSDGGYIVVGYTSSFGHGGEDVYLIKTDAQGNLLWQKTFGGSDDDGGYSVQQTTDGGYIIVGGTRSFGHGGEDVYLIKTDAQGNLLWQKTFGGSDHDGGYSVQQTTDGGYIIVGTTESFGHGSYEVYLIKTDAQGNLLWQKTFGGSDADWANSVDIASDGGYIIIGYTYSFGNGNGDIYMIKTNSQGGLLWQKTLGGPEDDAGVSTDITIDGGFIVTGLTNSYGNGGGDVILVKHDGEGNVMWRKTFGGPENDVGNSVKQTEDGGFIIAGAKNWEGKGNDSDIYLIKTDSEGNVH